MLTLPLNRNDVGIIAYELSEICRTLAYILPWPFIVTIIYLPHLDLIDLLIYLLKKFVVFFAPAVAAFLFYLLLKRVRIEETPRTRHTMITVSLAWLFAGVFGAIPYILNGTLCPLDAFFESMSGWSTTGLSMIPSPENIDKDLLFYRSYTQWIGGIGIIVLSLVVFLRRGTVAMDYYAAEVGEQRIRPKLMSTIIETWKIYIVYTIAFMVMMYLAGMGFYDAVIHTFSALSTAGFSSHGNSIGYYSNNPLIQLIVIACMFTGAVSFFLHFRLFEGDYRSILSNVELKYFVRFIVAATVFVFLYFYSIDPQNFDFIDTFINVLFQVVSAASTTGMQTVDLSIWPPLPLLVLVFLMFIGGLYGSTVGGIKMLRFVLALKAVEYSIKKLLLPKTAVIRIKIEGRHIDWNAVVTTFGFFIVYFLVFAAGALVLIIFGYDVMNAVFVSISALSNVGLSNAGGNIWYSMHAISKVTIILMMWVGRIEIFPVLVLLSSLSYRRTARIE